MTDLIAEGPQPHQRWRRPLREGDQFIIGRTVDAWATPWDSQISREHVQLVWSGGELAVTRLPSGRNPVFFHGQQNNQFRLRPGDYFVIGQTRFTLSDQQAQATADTPKPFEEQSYSAQYLKNVRFSDAGQRLEVLSRLPEVIRDALSDHDLFVRLVNMVLVGIPSASAVAIVVTEGRDDSPVEILHWDQRFVSSGEFQPSRRLILEALRQQQSKLHVWKSGHDTRSLKFTVSENVDWAFCTPVPGPACAGWGIYVAGKFGQERPGREGVAREGADLREDLKFTEIVAGTLASLRQLSHLQRQQASLSQFFPPAVLEALRTRPPEEVLAPRETNVSVLFCDLRGFSREVEADAEDLMGLLRRVSQALGVMTRAILQYGGVVGDFHGDAAMGFWGWPLQSADTVARAASAALAIRNEFAAASRMPDHPLAGFRAGIGLATGKAVAGGIGTSDQVKVTVFGHVVNLASRMEGMTKQLHAPILIDQATADAVRQLVPRDQARVRTVAKVVPYGMQTPLMIHELLPPAGEFSELTDTDVANYEKAVAHFMAKEWREAYAFLHQVSPNDLVKDFLLNFIIEHKRQPPPDWDGTIELRTK